MGPNKFSSAIQVVFVKILITSLDNSQLNLKAWQWREYYNIFLKYLIIFLSIIRAILRIIENFVIKFF